MYLPFDKPDVPYTLFQDYIVLNAIRHMKRAGMHAANGNFDYADRSAEKAIRNFQRAALFDFKACLMSQVPWSVGTMENEG